jgi:hypothetical protein
MGGYAPEQVKKSQGGAAPPTIVGDGCDLQFYTDLVGVRAQVSATLSVSETLSVSLRAQGAVRSAVCSTAAGEVVGTLAAFRGLSRLIGCIESSVQYVAHVEFASATRCAVRVVRR